ARAAAARRAWPDVPLRRARHGRRHGGERPRAGARRGIADRRRPAQGDPRQRSRDRRLSRAGTPACGGAAMIPGEIALQTEGVQSGYGDAVVVRGVDMVVGKGTIVTVMGPNGSGKSTLIKTIVGLIPHRAGKTTVRDRNGRHIDITRKRPY